MKQKTRMSDYLKDYEDLKVFEPPHQPQYSDNHHSSFVSNNDSCRSQLIGSDESFKLDASQSSSGS